MVTVPVHLTEIHSWVSGFHIFLMCPGVFPDFCLTVYVSVCFLVFNHSQFLFYFGKEFFVHL